MLVKHIEHLLFIGEASMDSTSSDTSPVLISMGVAEDVFREYAHLHDQLEVLSSMLNLYEIKEQVLIERPYVIDSIISESIECRVEEMWESLDGGDLSDAIMIADDKKSQLLVDNLRRLDGSPEELRDTVISVINDMFLSDAEDEVDHGRVI